MGQSVVPAQESTDAMMRAYADNIDQIIAATSRNILPSEMAQLAAQEQLAPRQAELALRTARDYLPQFSALDTQIAGQRAASQAANDAALMRGAGRDVVQANIDLARLADPEYYRAREGTGETIDDLLSSLDDPNAGLSATERAEIERSMARTNAARGTETPTALGAVESAMNFGGAGAARKAQKQQAIAQAIGAAAQAMPSLRSGVDPLLTTLGRPSTPTPATAQYGGVTPVGAQSMTTANNFLGQVGQNVRQNQEINANRRTAFDSVMQVGNMVGSLAGSVI